MSDGLWIMTLIRTTQSVFFGCLVMHALSTQSVGSWGGASAVAIYALYEIADAVRRGSHRIAASSQVKP